MRLFLTVLMVFISFTSNAFAQSEDREGRTIYNRSQNSYGAKLYNAPGSYYNSQGPLSIKQMLRGKGDAADGNRSSYNRSRYTPYSMGSNSGNYSLALSPDEVRANRARLDAMARKRNIELERRKNQENNLYTQTNSYLNRFQSNQTSSATHVKATRAIYRKQKKEFEIPKKVFNSIR